jgi:hypothetical protein
MRQLTWPCGVDSPRALPSFPINLLIGALIAQIGVRWTGHRYCSTHQ